MQDDLAAGECVRDRLGTHEVAGEDIHLVGDGRFEPVEPATVAARVVANEPAHAGAARHEMLDQVAADEAARAGHEDAAPRPGTRIALVSHRG